MPSLAAEGLRTPSLRRRVTLVVLALIAAMLVTLVLVSDVALRNRLEGQLRQRLADRAVVADALADQVDTRDLARRLEGDGVSAVITTSSGEVFAEGPLAGAAPSSGPSSSPAPEGPGAPGSRGPGGKPPPRPQSDVSTADVVQSGDLLSLQRRLDDGDRLVLLADASDLRATLDQVRLVLWLAALVVLIAAAVVVPLVVSRAIAPLRTITEVADSITRGDRARRLRPRQPGTELGRTAVAFDAMLDEIVGSEERLRVFLSDAAHELRTPLTGIQASAELLLRENPDRAQREAMLLSLLRESGRAGRLVEDMLLMARIDEGLALQPRPVHLRGLADQVVESRRAAHPDAALRVEGPDVELDADPDRLTQVLGNLLDNALHATGPHGAVTARVWQGADRAGVDVADDGPGVPAGDRERIFERLVRLDAARSRHAGGAGLGLPIARGIARAHGGDLSLVNSDVGATFRLDLPIVAA